MSFIIVYNSYGRQCTTLEDVMLSINVGGYVMVTTICLHRIEVSGRLRWFLTPKAIETTATCMLRSRSRTCRIYVQVCIFVVQDRLCEKGCLLAVEAGEASVTGETKFMERLGIFTP